MAEPAILQHLQKVKRNGAGWTALCPGHDDKARSLSVTEADDRTLVHCFVGCTAEQIVKAAGLEWSDMFASPANGNVPQKRSEWQIKNLAGEIVATHIRLDPGKVIWWERNGERGLGGFPISSMPLYRTETLASLPVGQPVVITEGEKAADALLRFKVHVFATFGATSQPDDETLKPFVDRPVTLWPDNDAPGKSHMLKLGESLERVGARVKVLEWPAAPPKGDAYDFATAGATGATRDALIALLATARPLAEFGWDVGSLTIPTTEGVIEPPPTIERTEAGCRVIWDTGLATDYMALIERVIRRSDGLRC
ncbi:MAG: CHC2 zinc finger domain-containing protein, partial [Gemmatimonadaceae bacterium]|nr:CHC2 zinc finger domain-containing protein [Gemmatimonadaceae bacterium]